MKMTVVLMPSEDGGYTVQAPALQGCISQGDTKEEALINIKDAIELCLETDDDDLNLDPSDIVEEIELTHSKTAAVLRSSVDGGFVVRVPTMPGCFSQGETKEEALANIKDAMTLYLKTEEGDLDLGPNDLTEEVEI